jgi:quercetin dioxygenase-like cupin family protein
LLTANLKVRATAADSESVTCSERAAKGRATGLSGVRHTEDRSARHPGFHHTDTVDYAIVLRGEIWAVLDETETLLKSGDVPIQRGSACR